MARKDRSLAGFDDVANDNPNNDNNVNANVNINEGDYLDKIIEGQNKKFDLVLTGIYLEPELAALLDKLGKQGGRGTKSRIANDALRALFVDKGLL